MMENEKAEIARLAEKYGRVQSLMQYANKKTLAESYAKQLKNKAVGVDGVTKEEYGENLDENITSLIDRMKKFSYKPYPVRRAYIPKANGKLRGLGIPSFEDKVVQGVFKEILEAIYEPKFKEFSFGFRPNRGCHDAIQRINKHIMADKVNYIVDADIKGFFDNIDHDWMTKFLEHDIADKNFIRYIKRFLIGGVMEEGKRLETELGTVQGGLISPVLANVYLHYALDTWFEYVKKHEFKGEMYMVRYADDFVCLFQFENEARKFYRMMIERLKKFGLEIAEDKSRILPFGRYRGTKETFDFLGFTHINGKSHWGKYCVLHRTSKKKLIQKRQNAKKWLREHMHDSIPETIEQLNRKLVGHYNYYGIYGNWISLKKFYSYVKWELFRTKRRRDQSYWLTWAKFKEITRIHPLEWPKIRLTSAY
jgi:group II intron reverse transcriptase/maturase